jgi:hypothetical protein
MRGRDLCLCPCGILLTNVSLFITKRWVDDGNTIVPIAEVLLEGIAIGPGREPCRKVGVFLRCVIGIRHDDKLWMLTWMEVEVVCIGVAVVCEDR